MRKVVITDKDEYVVEVELKENGDTITNFISSKNGLVEGMWTNFTHGKGLFNGDIINCCKDAIRNYEEQSLLLLEDTKEEAFVKWDGDMRVRTIIDKFDMYKEIIPKWAQFTYTAVDIIKYIEGEKYDYVEYLYEPMYLSDIN